MDLKELDCEYGVDGNGGVWYCIFEMCYSRFSYIMVGVCVLAAVSWFYFTLIFRPTRVLLPPLQNTAIRNIRVEPYIGMVLRPCMTSGCERLAV